MGPKLGGGALDHPNVFIRLRHAILAGRADQQVFLPESAILLGKHLHDKLVQYVFRNMMTIKASAHNDLLGRSSVERDTLDSGAEEVHSCKTSGSSRNTEWHIRLT